MNTQAKKNIFNCNSRIARFIFAIFFMAPSILYCQQYPGIQWQKCVGGAANDWAYSILQTSDGGYIAVGQTLSNDGDFISNHGNNGVRGNGGFDGWIGKFDSLGTVEWLNCLGGMGDDMLSCIIKTYDGGYIAAGYTTSFDGDVSGQHGGITPSIEYPCRDIWVVKLSNSGRIEWQKCLGGQGSEYAMSIIQNSDKDKGYTIIGSTNLADGEVSGYHPGIYAQYFDDVWVVHLSSEGKIKWQKCLGGSDKDYASSIIEDADNGYVVAGATQSSDGDVVGFHGPKKYQYPDGWIVKINDTGKIAWQKCLGGSGYTEFRQIIRTKDGGYAAAGNTNCTDGDVSGNHGGEDAWVVKLDFSGTIQWQKCFGGAKDDQVYSIIQTPDKGYAVAGSTYSIDENMPANHGKSDAWIFKLDSSGNMQWQKYLGGSGDDAASSIIRTSDGGYAITGGTSSNDGDVSGLHDSTITKTADAWIVKLNGTDNLAVLPASTTGEFSFSTYPNPANSQMTIHAASNIKISNVNIFDMLGRKWECPLEIKDDHNIMINTAGLPPGSYVGRSLQLGKNYMIPFMVQH